MYSGDSSPVRADRNVPITAGKAGQECPDYFAFNTPRMMMPWPGKLQTKG
jgi:hypothetical protein